MSQINILRLCRIIALTLLLWLIAYSRLLCSGDDVIRDCGAVKQVSVKPSTCVAKADEICPASPIVHKSVSNSRLCWMLNAAKAMWRQLCGCHWLGGCPSKCNESLDLLLATPESPAYEA